MNFNDSSFGHSFSLEFKCLKNVLLFKFWLFWYTIAIFIGHISISDWCQAMEETTHLGLPWRMLKDKLVRTDPETRRVRYMDTFDLYASVSFFSVMLPKLVITTPHILKCISVQQCTFIG